jgi:apolipoprotein N-acyltransferase
MIPWTVAGGVSPWPAMVQLADVCGERGVAFLMALAAGLAASGLRLARARDATTRRRGWAYVAGAVAVVTAQGLYGAARMKGVASWRAQAPTARVALVQASIGATTRWDDDRAPDIVQALRTLTTRAEAEGADLVVWPEGAYPYRIVHGARREGPGERPILGPGQHGPILTGLLTTGPAGAYNSAVVATRSGLSEGYDKRRLLWFGETVPLADRLPWMRRVFARGLGLVPGDKPVILPAGPVRASVLVCYEDTLPEAGRDGMAGAPNLLVNITNDAWFGGGESELHLRMAVLRSVELRRDMVRAVNLGVPSWVDATGRIRARGSPEFPDVLETQPALLDAPVTLYARFGDFPWALAALLLANVAVWKSVKRRG